MSQRRNRTTEVKETTQEMIEINEEINNIAKDMLARYTKAIKDSGHSASGQLADTATYRVEFDGRWVDIIFTLQDYWKYIEDGTRPHFPPIEEIEKWITVKRIVPYSINGKVPSTKQLAYLISRKISREGTPAEHILRKCQDGYTDLVRQLQTVLYNQINKEVNKETEQINESIK